jgi:hypothetical protein
MLYTALYYHGTSFEIFCGISSIKNVVQLITCVEHYILFLNTEFHNTANFVFMYLEDN